jgi:hypothetical protein
LRAFAALTNLLHGVYVLALTANHGSGSMLSSDLQVKCVRAEVDVVVPSYLTVVAKGYGVEGCDICPCSKYTFPDEMREVNFALNAVSEFELKLIAGKRGD